MQIWQEIKEFGRDFRAGLQDAMQARRRERPRGNYFAASLMWVWRYWFWSGLGFLLGLLIHTAAGGIPQPGLAWAIGISLVVRLAWGAYAGYRSRRRNKRGA